MSNFHPKQHTTPWRIYYRDRQLLKRISEISAKTGFDQGEPFDDPKEVREYFRVARQVEMFGPFEAETSQPKLDAMADLVIDLGLHMSTETWTCRVPYGKVRLHYTRYQASGRGEVRAASPAHVVRSCASDVAMLLASADCLTGWWQHVTGLGDMLLLDRESPRGRLWLSPTGSEHHLDESRKRPTQEPDDVS